MFAANVMSAVAQPFSFTMSGIYNDVNLRSAAVGAGWNQNDPVIAAMTGEANSMTINGSFPGGVRLNHSGTIYNGLNVSVPTTVANSGSLWAAGGPGGQGITIRMMRPDVGYDQVEGGFGGAGAYYAWNGSGFTYNAATAGASANYGVFDSYSGAGGAGGDIGDYGQNGSSIHSFGTHTGTQFTFGPYSPEGPGFCVTGNSFITWAATGSRLGQIA